MWETLYACESSLYFRHQAKPFPAGARQKLRDLPRVTSPGSRMELCLIPELLGWVEPGRAWLESGEVKRLLGVYAARSATQFPFSFVAYDGPVPESGVASILQT